MATPNRAAILTKAHKGLKKHFTPVKPTAERTVLECLLYACCLENSPYDKADEGFAALTREMFDWNEIRVSTVTELAEVLKCLPDPARAASHLKRSLQSVFESQFSFDLEPLRKENIGKAAKQLGKYDGVTPFAVAYVTQNALGGHAIPVDDGVLGVMRALGVITAEEAEKRIVPGLERAIPKSKGIEFGSLVHQLGADFHTSPFSPRVRAIILEIAPDARERLPKRGAKKKAARKKEKKAKPDTAKAKKPAAEKPPAKKTAKKTAPAKPKGKPAKRKPAAGKSATRRLAKRKPR